MTYAEKESSNSEDQWSRKKLLWPGFRAAGSTEKHTCLEGNLITWPLSKITIAEQGGLWHVSLWMGHCYHTHELPAAISVCLRLTQGQASQPAKLGEVFARPCLLWRSYWMVRVHERRKIILTFAYLSVRVWQLVANGPGSAHTLVALIGLRRLLKQ